MLKQGIVPNNTQSTSDDSLLCCMGINAEPRLTCVVAWANQIPSAKDNQVQLLTHSDNLISNNGEESDDKVVVVSRALDSNEQNSKSKKNKRMKLEEEEVAEVVVQEEEINANNKKKEKKNKHREESTAVGQATVNSMAKSKPANKHPSPQLHHSESQEKKKKVRFN